MKHLPIILIVLATISVSACSSGNEQQIRELQTQLEKQEKSATNWQLAAFCLGIGAVVTLVIGTSIGSKARKESHV